jgi:hypothetical protein
MEIRLNKDALRKAIKRLDHRGGAHLLEPSGWREEDVDEAIQQIIHTGCLIQPYGSDGEAAGKKSALSRLISEHATLEQLERFTKHLLQATLLQLAFKEIKNTISESAVAQLKPSDHVWAVVDRGMTELANLAETIQSIWCSGREDTEAQMTYGGLYVPDASGQPVDADAVVNSLQSYLYLTLSMLAYENKWWSKDGVLVLPPRTVSAPEHLFKARTHILLATAWDSLHTMSESLRFFGGEILFKGDESEGKESDARVIHVKRNADPHLLFHIARLRQGQAQTEAAVNWALLGVESYKDPRDGIVRMPPLECVSHSESDAVFLLQARYFYDIDSEQKIGGLSIAKWIRGYAVLKLFCESPKDSQDSATRLDVGELHRALTNASFCEQESELFIRSVVFKKISRDLYDCPLLHSSDGNLYFLSALYRSASILEIAISQWRTLGYTFADKGGAFEDSTLSLFQGNGVPAKSFTIADAGETFQFDVLAPWGDFAFLLECKNYLLPSDSPVEEFYFLQRIDEAVEQVLRLEAAISAYPGQIEEQLGVSVKGMKVVPIVLNAMPFSLPRQLKGVYVADYPALAKFFDGYITIGQQLSRGEQKVRVEHITYKFWNNESPTAEDLLRNLAAPIHLRSEWAQWYLMPMTLPLSKKLTIELEVLRRVEPSFESFLAALGNNENKIKLMRTTMNDFWKSQS